MSKCELLLNSRERGEFCKSSKEVSTLKILGARFSGSLDSLDDTTILTLSPRPRSLVRPRDSDGACSAAE